MAMAATAPRTTPAPHAAATMTVLVTFLGLAMGGSLSGGLGFIIPLVILASSRRSFACCVFGRGFPVNRKYARPTIRVMMYGQISQNMNAPTVGNSFTIQLELGVRLDWKTSVSHSQTRAVVCRDCLLYTSDAADDLLCVDLG